MKELHTYITEKLSIDDVTLDDNTFSGKIDYESFVSYLLRIGFEEINGHATIESLKTAFNKAHGKVMTLSSGTLVIRFANTSKEGISSDNPIYACKFYKGVKGVSMKPVYATEAKEWWETRLDEKDFIEEIKKIVK